MASLFGNSGICRLADLLCLLNRTDCGAKIAQDSLDIGVNLIPLLVI